MASPFVCTNCQERRWVLAWARAEYRAEGAVRTAIHAFKYNGDYFWLDQLTDWLEEGYRDWAAMESWDALVPVPLYWTREWRRGFNQARELAQELSRRVKVPCQDVLTRSRATGKQARLERAGRLRNMRRAFRLKKSWWGRRFDVEGKSLLIIDDVFTTGATAEACARVLQQYGAKRVAVLTVARG
jgi:ComF family protein